MIIKGTSCYANAKAGNLVSITGDGGNAWGFYGNAYKKMSPKLYLWQYYDQNSDNLSEDELIDWYKEYSPKKSIFPQLGRKLICPLTFTPRSFVILL